jgi:hypothetical protein
MKRENVKRERAMARRRCGRSHVAAITFLFTFTVLIIAVCYYFLFPALEASKHAPPQDKAKLRAYASLLLAIILIVLLCGVLLTVRIGRFFFPRPTPPRTRTKYVDAWAESAKRMEAPPRESERGDEDPG